MVTKNLKRSSLNILISNGLVLLLKIEAEYIKTYSYIMVSGNRWSAIKLSLLKPINRNILSYL